MTVKELKECLSKWPEDTDIYVVAIMPTKRLIWPGNKMRAFFIENNRGEPVIGLELDKGEPMDEEMIRAAEADEAAVGWIPVAERMPERNKSVLLCMKSRSSRTGMCIQTGSYDNGFWFVQGAAGYESLATFEFYVLAWMPLPEPYREV